MECTCTKCGMKVKGLTCGKCNTQLTTDSITKDDGEKIQVAKCPSGCGAIKSPTCCGQDMTCAV